MKTRFLNIAFFLVLALPALQYRFKFFTESSLYNVPIDRKFPQLSLDGLVSGKFQGRLERWLIQNTGLFGTMIRMQNSINYHLLNSVSSDPRKGSLMGNDWALFDRIYVNDLNGIFKRSDYLPPEETAARLRRMQDFFKSKGKEFLLVIHPNKAIFHPAWVPDSFKVGRPGTRQIDLIRPALEKHGINYVEVGNKFDRSVMHFPKSGAHLNYYGMCVATREVSKAFSPRIATQIPQFECVRKEQDRPPKLNELDLTDLLNVWDSSPSEAPVPDFDLKITKQAQPKLKLFVSGTSYVFGLLNNFDNVNAFAETNFKFYNKSLYSYTSETPLDQRRNPRTFKPKKHTSLGYLLSHDIIMFESTDARILGVGGQILNKFKNNRIIERFNNRKSKKK